VTRTLENRSGGGRPSQTEPIIRFQRPLLPSASQIDRYLDLSREARWFSNSGPCWCLLRDRLADRVGAYCVPVASGTLGLMVAIASLTKTSPDSGASGALMPSFTFLATAQAAIWSGFQPRLIDVDPTHWHIDASRLERVLRDHRGDLSLVTAVCTFGTPPPSETRLRWERACRSAGVPLIFDSAAAFGAVADDGVHIGAQGDIEVVSFHATKPFAIGEGGAVFTRDRALYEKIELAVNFGLRPDRSATTAMGLNAKMSELHAATALAVLDEYDLILESRRDAAAKIRAGTDPDITWQTGCERSTWQFVPVVFPDADHRRRAERRCEGRVEVRTYYEPLHLMEPFSSYPVLGDGLACTAELCDRVLCLPMANDLSSEEVLAISAIVDPDPQDDVSAQREVDPPTLLA
jgi:dTDP-4-amino-4,6-dideoxygalactose transaminase